MKNTKEQPSQRATLWPSPNGDFFFFHSVNHVDDRADRENVDYKLRPECSHMSLSELNYLLIKSDRSDPVQERRYKQSALASLLLDVLFKKNIGELFKESSKDYHPIWTGTAIRLLDEPEGVVQIFDDIDGKVYDVTLDTSGGHVDAQFLFGYSLKEETKDSKGFFIGSLCKHKDQINEVTMQELDIVCPEMVKVLFGVSFSDLSPIIQKSSFIIPKPRRYISTDRITFHREDYKGMVLPIGVHFKFHAFGSGKTTDIDDADFSRIGIDKVTFVPYDIRHSGNHFYLFR
jgi:hypothetical protein